MCTCSWQLTRVNISQSSIFVCCFQMELDRSADPPPAIWVATTKSTVNKWVSKPLYAWQRIRSTWFVTTDLPDTTQNAQYETGSQQNSESSDECRCDSKGCTKIKVVVEIKLLTCLSGAKKYI